MLLSASRLMLKSMLPSRRQKQKELLDRIRLMHSDMKRNATQKQRLLLKCAKQKQKPKLLLSVPKL